VPHVAGRGLSLTQERLIGPESMKALGELGKEQDALQERQTEEVLRNVPEEPGQRPGPLPAQEGVERVPQGNLPPGDQIRRGTAEEAAQSDLSLIQKEVPKDPVARSNFETEFLERGQVHNQEQGLPAEMRAATPAEEKGAGWIATVSDDGRTVVVNRAKFGPWLERLKPADRPKAINSLFSEEGIHGVARRSIPDEEIGELFKSLTGPERALIRNSYGELDPKAIEAGVSPDVLYGHEYLRRQMQRMLREPVREKAEAKGYQWLKESAIDAIERVIIATRRLAGSKASKTLDSMLGRMQEHIDAARKVKGMEPVDWEAQLAGAPAATEKAPRAMEKGAQEEEAAKPEVARSSSSTLKNAHGDPMGTTYHATPEDWAKWQEVQADFKRLMSEGKGLDNPEMAALWKQNETLKNKYGGMPPAAPKAASIEGTPRAMERSAATSEERDTRGMVARVQDFFGGLPGRIRAAPNKFAGQDVPMTYTASPDSANAVVEYASSRIAAPEVARAMASEVLGERFKDTEFGNELGAVLVEDRLRAIREGLREAGKPEEAAKVTSIIGKEGSPFASEADFRRALNDPDIRQAIQRHKQTVQEVAQTQHEKAGGELAGAGLNTGAFVNLKAVFEGNEGAIYGGAGRGNLLNPLRRPSRFSKKAKGTAEKYELDYRTLAQRMIEGNFQETTKRRMYGQLVRDGLAIINNPGDPAPKIGGKEAVKFTIERKGVPAGGGKARTFVKNLYVRSDIAPEVREALNVDGKTGEAALLNAANALNQLQLVGPTDAVWHIANMIGSIAGSQGGKTMLRDLARKLPGVNIADALGRTTASAIKVLAGSPEIQRQVAELAKIGAMREANVTGRIGTDDPKSLLRLLNPHNMIQLLDRAGRLVRDDLYKNLVDRGMVTDTPANRRLWVNQMGQYNGRLMSKLQRSFKEWGFSPFVVAGRNFNRMAMRRIALSPGLAAKNPVAAAQMKAVEAFGMLATLVAVPAFFNYVLTGNPSGRDGTKQGQIDLGKDTEDGKHIVIDPAQWTGLRRGLRISGLQALMEGKREGQRGKKITQQAARDILGGIIHPWTGPAVTSVSVGTTGYNPGGYKESHNPKDYAENLKAALKQLNPVAEALITGHEEKRGPVTQLGLSLGGAFGLKAVRGRSAYDKMQTLHENWLANNPDEFIKQDYERNAAATYPISKYHDLDRALQSGNKKQIAQAIEELRPLVKRDSVIRDRMQPWTENARKMEINDKPLFQGSQAMEQKFLQTLTPEQREIYQKAQEERREKWLLFLDVWNERP